MGKIAVISCAHWAWINSSRTMGENLAHAIGSGVQSNVHTPINKSGFCACLSEVNYAVIHTHGSPQSFINQLEDGEQKQIISLNQVKVLPTFSNLRIVVITACLAAEGEENIARELSRHIASNGLVFANRYVVFGADYDFGERDSKNGWVAYRNGELVLKEWQIAPRITMADAFNIYVNYSKK